MTRAACLALLLPILGGCRAPPPPPSPPRGWGVERGFVRDEAGRAVIFRGVNLAGAHKQPPYFDFQQPADYRRLREQWGFNSVRFLILWAAVEPREGEYDEGYLDGVATRLEWAREAGLKVVLDMHQDLWGEGFSGGDGAPRWACEESRYAAFTPTSPWFLGYLDPNVVACFDGLWKSRALQARYAAAWRHVAERMDNEAVVGFDPMNEPFWGSFPIDAFEGRVLQPFYGKVVQEVRAVRPGWLAFLEPSAGRNLGFATGLSPFPFEAVVYAPHAYDSQAEGGKPFDPARREALLSNVAALGGEAQGLGAALWIGEYGGFASQPGITEYMDALYDAAGKLAAGTQYWQYGRDNGYGLLLPDGSEKPLLLDVLVRPYPERVAGEPISYAWEEATGTFTLRYLPDPALGGQTLLSVPARRYPGGFEVECGGCEEQRTAEGVLLGAPAGEGEATVVVRPRGP
ncbi:MAG: cellulase family glycosylhydrolase [Myxococcaceae bacterium]